jgi:hypothetical protein
VSESEIPTRAKPAALKPGDLERVRKYRPDVVEVERVREADLSAALAFLPAELHAEAEEHIRNALRGYLLNASSEHEPPEAAQARYFRSVEAQARELARLLLPRDDIEPKHWKAPGMVSGAVALELSVRAGPSLTCSRNSRISWARSPGSAMRPRQRRRASRRRRRRADRGATAWPRCWPSCARSGKQHRIERGSSPRA